MFEVNERIEFRSMKWRVLEAEDIGAFQRLKLEGIEEGVNSGLKITVISGTGMENMTPIQPEKLELGSFAPPSLWDAFMTAITISLAQPRDMFSSLLNSRIKIEKYQFVPLIKALNSLPPRILIADDVGLGKTVEAGIIFQELTSRNIASRVLIVVPASLQNQWKDEMKNKFGVDFEIFDSVRIKELRKNIVTGMNLWEKYPRIISSIDYLKRSDIRRQMADSNWDLVIIDEAHYLSSVGNTDRSRFGEFISRRAQALILLTATPHNGNDAAFIKLLRSLDPYVSEHVLSDKKFLNRYVVRRLKKDILDNWVRPDIETVNVSLSEGKEKEIYENANSYISSVWKKNEKENESTAFAMIILKKRMMSSFYSFKCSLENRRNKLMEYISGERGIEEGKFSIDTDKRQRYFEGTTLTEAQKENLENKYLEAITAGTPKEVSAEVETIDALLSKLNDLGIDPQLGIAHGDEKSRRLVSLLDELGVSAGREKAIVFTEYIDTQHFIVEFLNQKVYEGHIVTINGAMNSQEKEEAKRAFEHEDNWLLVATDAASEGLNFQERCHIVINYELPWNPNRLLQRIGRVDRYGQTERVIVKNLYFTNTYEGEILSLLMDKLKRIIDRIGSANDVLGMWGPEKLVPRLMETTDTSSAKAGLDRYFDEIEEIYRSNIVNLYGTLEDGSEEKSTVKNYLSRSDDYFKELEKMVRATLRKLNGSVNEIGKNMVKITVPPALNMETREVIGTFNRDYALEKTDIEFFSARQELVKAVVKYHRQSLYNPRAENRITYLHDPTDSIPESVVFFFYAKYVDRNSKLVAEKLLSIRISLDGQMLAEDYKLPSKWPSENIPEDFKRRIESRWDDLFNAAMENSDAVSLDKIPEIAKSMEEGISIRKKLVMSYYQRQIEMVKSDIYTLKKEAIRQSLIDAQANNDENEADRRVKKRKLQRARQKLEKLQADIERELKVLKNMKSIEVIENRIIGALIVEGGSK